MTQLKISQFTDFLRWDTDQKKLNARTLFVSYSHLKVQKIVTILLSMMDMGGVVRERVRP